MAAGRRGMDSHLVARTMTRAPLIQSTPAGLVLLRLRAEEPHDRRVIPWNSKGAPSLAATLAAANIRLTRAGVIVPRADLILISRRKSPEETAEAAVQRQLPTDFLAAPRVHSGDRIAIWPSDRRKAATDWLAEAGIQFDGALLADTVLPSATSDNAAWLVTPGPRAFRRLCAAVSNQPRLLLMISALLFLGGLFASRSAESMEASQRRLVLARERAHTTDSANARSQSLSLITSIARAVPKNTHLLELTVDESSRDVRLRGRAADYAAVSTLVSSLTSAGTLISVRPQRSSLVTVGGRQIVEFSIEAKEP